MEDWDAKKVLDLYIYDYLVRKNMLNVADTFAKEANFSPKSVSIDTPDGFLTEWWAIFWDIYNAAMAKNPEEGGMLIAQAKQMMEIMGGNVPRDMYNGIMDKNLEQGKMLVSQAKNMVASNGGNFTPNMYNATIAKNPEQGEMLISQMMAVMGGNVLPNMSMPNMNPMMLNANHAMRLPELPNMVQPINQLLMSRPGIRSLNKNPSTSIMPMLEEKPNRLGPASVIDFSSRQGQGMTNYLEAIMREQELHRTQATNFNFNLPLLNIDQLASMVPSSSTPKRAPKTLSIHNQPHVSRVHVNNSGTIPRGPAPLPVAPKPSETRVIQINTERADNGSSMSSNSNSTDPSYQDPDGTSSEMSMSL